MEPRFRVNSATGPKGQGGTKERGTTPDGMVACFISKATYKRGLSGAAARRAVLYTHLSESLKFIQRPYLRSVPHSVQVSQHLPLSSLCPCKWLQQWEECEERSGWNIHSKHRGSGEEPPIAWVWLAGQLGVTSSP